MKYYKEHVTPIKHVRYLIHKCQFSFFTCPDNSPIFGSQPTPTHQVVIGNRIHSINDIEKKSDRGPFQKLGITRRKYTIHETVHIAEIAKDN
jgi:hypothetical protein